MARTIAKTDGGDGRPRVAAGPGPVGVARQAPVRIRVALPRDGEMLAALRRQAEQIHARLLPDYFRVSLTRDAVGSPPDPSSVIIVAEGLDPGSSVLGYVSVKLVETPKDPAMTPQRRAHVDTIVVAESHRGLGIGTTLMRAASSWAERHEAAELVLTVWSENRAAQALYRRLGYRPIARILRRTLQP
jgi:ribosomal protein S18 acetylase RimI-like enzyme